MLLFFFFFPGILSFHIYGLNEKALKNCHNFKSSVLSFSCV